MRVALDIRKYYDFGIGTYIQNLMNEFDKQNEIQFSYFVGKNDFDNIRNKHNGDFILNESGKYSLSELFSFSKEIKNRKIDLFHAPHFTLPFNLHSKSIVTIHDIIPLRFPEYFPFHKRKYAEMLIKHSYKKSDYILVDSKYTKSDLVQYFNFDENKIIVIYLGIESQKINIEIDLNKKYGINKKYILYVGSVKPHKNLPFLLRAYSNLKDKRDLQFVFVGETLFDNQDLKKYLNDKSINAIFCGKIKKEDLSLIYKNAEMLLMPSLYEGFGFPILEAMIVGTPVVSSNATSLPEVCGEAAILFDPKSEIELISAIERILSQSEFRNNLIAKGFKQAKKFTWKECAEKTLQVYKNILQ